MARGPEKETARHRRISNTLVINTLENISWQGGAPPPLTQGKVFAESEPSQRSGNAPGGGREATGVDKVPADLAAGS